MDSNNKVEELQMLEGHLQNFLAQKQAVQIEVNEVDNAISELKNSEGEVYKMVSGFMIKSAKEKLSEELSEKKKLLDMRSDSMEKQEKLLEKNVSDLRKDIEKDMAKHNNK